MSQSNSSLTTTLNAVRSYLASIYMFVDEEWLSGCVEYLSETFGNNVRELQKQAREQWLLNNLTDICPGSLPNNLKSVQKTCLTGCFVLQINAAVDIGTPAYQQYLKLQKVNTENIEATTKFDDKIPNQRMIKLYMTDGVQEISGIEYKPMRNLSLDITPGCKVLIKGPVECRHGVILLTESSVELLGGEVQELGDSNSQPGLLANKLGLPLPTCMPDLIVLRELNLNETLNRPRNTNIPKPQNQVPTPVINEHTTGSSISKVSRPVARVTGIPVASFADDDIDIDELNALEAQYSDNPGKRSIECTDRQPEKKIKINTTMTTNTVDDYPDDNDLIFEDEDHLMEMEAKFDAEENNLHPSKNDGPVSVSSEPFVYIKQINDLKESDKMGKVFKVKGQILKLLSKLSVGKDGWSLRCTIVDGTGALDVDFTSDVLSKLVGLTPQEMNQIKTEMKSKPELKEKAVAALQKAKDSLQVLYCIIELTMLETPKITQLVPFDRNHIELLENRLQACVS